MDLRLKGKNGGGEGREHGHRPRDRKGLAAEGARVAVAARRRELLDKVAGQITAAGVARPSSSRLMSYRRAR